MRFIKLQVEAFQGIGRAEVDFGPGLNVLYGDNDLGKSTLAAAVRAALLVVPKSSEADGYVSWYADAPPRVKLTFCDDDDHFWEVSKVFSQQASAELRHSKDGVQFKLDCKSREVEEKLRGLLRWGIPSPGGKGAPRGLPTSFLANVLLAAQTDVDAILKQSLDKDGDNSGKLRLQNALATLAQDPMFKRILDAAQREYDQYFTETGRRRRTQGSKLMAANDEVKRFQREAEGLQSLLDESQGIEDHVGACRATHDACAGRVSDAHAALALAQAGFSNVKARSAAEQQLRAAQQVVSDLDGDAARLAELALAILANTEKVAMLEANVAQAQAAVAAAGAQLKAAEQAQQRVLHDQGEQGRQLRKAKLEGELASLRERHTQLQSQRELVRRASAAVQAWDAARVEHEEAQQAQQRAAAELKAARDALHTADNDLELARVLFAYTRFRALSAQLTEVEASQQSALAARAVAHTKAAEAAAIETAAEGALADAVARKAKLPTAEQVSFVELSRHTLDMAEAALGGGLSVRVRAQKKTALRAELDQLAAHSGELQGEQVFEAERSARLQIGEQLEVEVTAGGAEQRRAVESARAVWRDACEPLLAKAGAASLQELKATLSANSLAEQAAREQLSTAQQLRAEAKTSRERAELHEQQAARSAPDPSELQARRAALGGSSLEALDEQWVKRGKPNEARSEAEHERVTVSRKKAAELVNKLEQASTLSQHKFETAAKEAELTSQQAKQAQQAIDKAKLAELLSQQAGQAQQAVDDTKLAAQQPGQARHATRNAEQKAGQAQQAIDYAKLVAQQPGQARHETDNVTAAQREAPAIDASEWQPSQISTTSQSNLPIAGKRQEDQAKQTIGDAKRQARRATGSAKQQADEAQRAVDNAKPAELDALLERAWHEVVAAQGGVQKAIAALASEHSDRQVQGERAVKAAQAALDEKLAASTAAQQLLAAERTSLNKMQGEQSVREQQLARQDRAALERQVELCQKALAALPTEPLATEQDVEAAQLAHTRAERELAEAAQEFFKAEGALSKAGGLQLKEQLQQAQDGLKAARARERELETDAEAWKLLREKLKLAEDSEATHLGRALSEPVGQRFAELTRQRYTNLELSPLLSAAGLQVAGVAADGDVLSALSVGTRDQLAALVRLTIAGQLKSSIILDDHLVQTDPSRLLWFRDVLLKTALDTQVVIFTCRPTDYLKPEEMPGTDLARDLAGGTIRALNLNGVVQRWQGARPPQ